MTVLLYILGAYVAVCWLWGMYLAIRLYTGRRLRHVMQGRAARARLIPKPTLSSQATHAGVPVADALAKSKAA